MPMGRSLTFYKVKRNFIMYDAYLSRMFNNHKCNNTYHNTGYLWNVTYLWTYVEYKLAFNN